ncbi:MAG TPA: hypothetical protein VIK72_08005 [Clostridiaceae bacterium]
MKKVILLTLLIASLIFYGCQSKSSITSSQVKSKVQPNTVTSTPPKATKEDVTSDIPNITQKSTESITQPNPIEKELANNKLDTTINSINSSLDTLDDVQDINLNSVK